MSRSLPAAANLQQLRKQAKDLVKAHRSRDRGVCEILRHLRQFTRASEEEVFSQVLSLQDAQHALAQDYGFAGWAEMKRHVEGNAGPSAWTETVYKGSVSSRCWWFTAYDGGWCGWQQLEQDGELKQIVEMERALGGVPVWADAVVLGPIRHVAPCGHYRFPLSYLDAVRAIGAQQSPPLTHTCYTVEPHRKRQFLAYARCIEAWLADAAPGTAATSMDDAGVPGIDWGRLCHDLWRVLGQPTDLKRMLLERWLLQTRWLVKSTTWDGDRPDHWPDHGDLGTRQQRNTLVTDNGNPHYKGPGWDLQASPRVRELEAQLASTCSDWPFFKGVLIEFYWPCAPKAFRFLEKTLWCVGREKQVINLPSFPLANPEDVPPFLQAQDTPMDRADAAQWWSQFLAALEAWWQGRASTTAVGDEVGGLLGPADPVKRWLVRLLAHRLRRLEDTRESLHTLLHRRT